jgi:hypothetical protein
MAFTSTQIAIQPVAGWIDPLQSFGKSLLLRQNFGAARAAGVGDGQFGLRDVRADVEVLVSAIVVKLAADIDIGRVSNVVSHLSIMTLVVRYGMVMDALLLRQGSSRARIGFLKIGHLI